MNTNNGGRAGGERVLDIDPDVRRRTEMGTKEKVGKTYKPVETKNLHGTAKV